MTFDPTVTLGSLLSLVGMIATVVAAYYKMQQKADSQFARFQEDIQERFESVDGKFAGLNLQLTALLEGDVREMRARLVILESGQSEWIKTVRDRTHDLAGKVNEAFLRIDRLERPRGDHS